MPFFYETHMHTCQASACGKATGAEQARAYRDAGYTGIIITDHFFGGNTAIDRTLPWEERVDLFWRGYEDAKKEGDRIRVIGPLGNGFPEAERFAGKRAVLFGGGIGIPPMLFAAKRLRNAGAFVTTFLGYRDRQTFLSEEFMPFAEVNVATEDGSIGTKGNVMDAFLSKNLEPDVIFACGPAPMLSAIRSFSMEREIPCYISLEERMACGIGACLGCVKKTTEIDSHSGVKNARVCRDGPVFKAELVDL